VRARERKRERERKRYMKCYECMSVCVCLYEKRERERAIDRERMKEYVCVRESTRYMNIMTMWV
jgi:hypothetical protein